MNIPSYKTLYFRIYYAGGGVPTGTSDRILSNLKFKVGTTYKTLQQMVADEDIEPIVIINSNGRKRLTAKTYMEDAINLYTGGDAIYCRWSNIDLILMTKNIISGFTVTTQDTTLNINNEGWLALMQDTSDFRLTLNEW